MYLMPSETNQSGQWAVFAHMRGVLCGPGAVHASEQTARCCDVGGHRTIPCEPWPGASAGVRCPFPGETPLSAAEVGHGLKEGLF